jgi:hypothetical protein
MIVKVTLEAMITLPEGTKWPSFGDIGSREFTLPNGDWVKPWIVLEWNDMDDLTTTQTEAMSIDINNTDCTIEAAGWAVDDFEYAVMTGRGK